jgi:hypothetical protein
MTHPVVLFLGIGGALASARSRRAGWFLPCMAGFALLAGWGRELVPDLQLTRMAVPLAFVALLPAAIAAARILQTGHPRLAIVRAALLGLLVMGGWNASRIYGNRGPGRYNVKPPGLLDLMAWVRNNTEPDDRILLAGGCSHFYESGYVACLPILFEREMFSSEYSHDQRRERGLGTPPELPPEEGNEFARFVHAYGAGYVFTLARHEDWVRALSAGEHFEPVAELRDGYYRVYRIREPTTRFLQGTGSVRAEMNRLTVDLEDPNATAVIRYNWIDGLVAEAPARIEPFETEDGFRFIAIRPGGKSKVTIRFGRRI